jgi:hypothetical protein
VVLRFRLRFTSAFVRLRRDKSARQGCIRLRPRRAGRSGVSAAAVALARFGAPRKRRILFFHFSDGGFLPKAATKQHRRTALPACLHSNKLETGATPVLRFIRSPVSIRLIREIHVFLKLQCRIRNFFP